MNWIISQDLGSDGAEAVLTALEEGDERWEVAFVGFLLADYGYYDVPHVEELFDAELVDAFRDY